MTNTQYLVDPGVAAWQNFFLSQQHGDGISGFEGVPFQRGSGIGSIFRGLLRLILPVAKSAGKTAIKAIGRQALSTGSELAGDVLRGEEIKKSMNKRGRRAVKRLASQAGRKLSQAGRGRRQKGKGLGTRSKNANIALGTKTAPTKRKTTKNKKRGRKDAFDTI